MQSHRSASASSGQSLADDSPGNQTSLISTIDQDESDQKVAAASGGSLWEMVSSMATKGEPAPNHDGHIGLDSGGSFGLDWKADYNANKINFALKIDTSKSQFRPGSDIFALGFSQTGQLESSDFCLLWYDLAHRLHLQDARTDSSSQLELIDQDVSVCRLIGPGLRREAEQGDVVVTRDEPDVIQAQQKPAESPGTTKPGLLVVDFQRPLDVCSSPRGRYYHIDNGTSHLVWFSLRGPLISLDGLVLNALRDEPSAHVAGGATKPGGQFESGLRRVQLVAPPAKHRRPAEPASSRIARLDFKMDSFKVPARETTYWCKLFKLAHKFETRRFHMTGYEAVIEPANEHVVHHMELFNCANLSPSQADSLAKLHESGGWAGDCDQPGRPKATLVCKRVVMAWAMGARPLVYPDDVGQQVGGHDYSPFMVLEVHYNNVDRRPDLTDSSGLSMNYTSRLRPLDAGILEVGLEYTDKNSIPPRLVAPLAGHCVSECTRLALSSSQQQQSCLPARHAAGQRQPRDLEPGIYIFAGQLHTHLAGVASWTEHVRQGRLIGEVQRDDHYSPHFQEIRMLAKPVHVAPGDALVHYCLYDTRNRANVTLGGFATTDEMCVTYLHYYPRVDLDVCKSSVDSRALEAYFAAMASEEAQKTSDHLRELAPLSNDSKSTSENYRSIDWSKRRSQELLNFYHNAPLSVQCNRSDGSRYPGYWNGLAPTKIWPPTAKLEPRAETGDSLASYRGQGYARRHEHCDSSPAANQNL